MSVKLSCARLVLLSALFIYISAITCFAAIINVPNDQPSIEAALNAASNGDIIELNGGTYSGNGNYNIKWNKNNIILRRALSATSPATIDALSQGRIISFEATNLTIEGITIQNGKYNNNGGGILLSNGSRLWLNNIVVKNCTAEGINNGGAVYSDGATVEADRCSFVGNRADNGGGVALGGYWKTINCLFENNYAVGGGVFGVPSQLNAVNCIFRNNRSGQGGVGGGNYGNYNMVNCVFYGNSSTGQGGVGFAGNWNVINCSFYGNTSSSGGGVARTGTWTCVNSIFWGGSDPFSSTTGTLNNCDIQGEDWAGFTTTTECFSKDPRYKNAAAGDLHLQPTSPCIDSGITQTGVATRDIEDIQRPVSGFYDMGAYECHESFRVWNNTTSTGYYKIQSALSDAAPHLVAGSYITAEAGVFTEHDIIWTNLNNITLSGEGSNITIISAEGMGGVIKIPSGASTLTIEGLTMRDGRILGMGGGICSQNSNGRIWLDDVTIENCSAEGESIYGGFGHGGAIYTFNSTIYAANCTFRNNKAHLNGGAFLYNGGTPLRAVNCTFDNNTAGGAGGAIKNGYIIASSCAFSNNNALSSGVFEGGTLNAIDCIFTDNSAIQIAGVSWVGSLTVTNCAFSRNTSPSGGAFQSIFLKATNCIFNNNTSEVGGVSYYGSINASNCTFEGNSAGNGGVSNLGNISAINCTFKNNYATNEGGIAYGGTVSATQCSFANNKVTGALGLGGVAARGIWNVESCTFTLNSAEGSTMGSGGVDYKGIWKVNNCTFNNNRAKYSGVSHQGTWEVKNSTFNRNNATSLAGVTWYGNWIVSDSVFNGNFSPFGGVALWSTWNINNCTFTSNEASEGGVAVCCTFEAVKCKFIGNIGATGSITGRPLIYNSYPSILNATNCIFIGNSAGIGGISHNSDWTATNCTFYGNSAPTGSIAVCDSPGKGAWQSVNSIFWGNGNNLFSITGAIGSLRYCDVQNGSLAGLTIYECFSSNPRFVDASANNLRLQPFSPCIDMGTIETGVPAFDADNASRPKAYLYDVGAYEYQGAERVMNNRTGRRYYRIQSPLREQAPYLAAGDLITAEAGIFYEHNIRWPAIDRITLRGEGSNETIISAEAMGRGISVEGAVNLTIEGLTIKDARIIGEGAGIFLPDNSKLWLKSIIISNCSAEYIAGGTGWGGAVYCTGSLVDAQSCEFNNNTAFNGAVFGLYDIHLGATNCIFDGNIAQNDGGVIYETEDYSSTTNCIFINNQALRDGGVINQGWNWTATNCIFYGNSAGSHGGVASAGQPVYFVNCTFYNNSAIINGDITGGSCIIQAKNSIFWGSNDPFYDSGSNMKYSTFECCDVQNGNWVGAKTFVGCIAEDPQFVNASAGDFHIPLKSPCVDSGTAGTGVPPFDLDYNPRPKGSLYDMGAYEYQGGERVWNNRTGRGYYKIQSALRETAPNLAAGDLITAEGGVFLEHDIKWPSIGRITLRGAGSNETIISAEALGRCISVEGAVRLTIEALTMQNGKMIVADGGGVYLCNGSRLWLNNVLFKYCNAGEGGNYYNGGAVYSSSSTVEANSCGFIGNRSNNAGGVARSGDWKTYKCLFEGNGAVGGGVVYLGTGTWNSYSSIYKDNYADNGGVFRVDAADRKINLINCIFISNEATYTGGVGGTSGTFNVANCTFYGNSAPTGGVGDHGTWVNVNSIYWGSSAPFSGTTGTLRYCDVQNGAWGGLPNTGCITLAPSFENASAGDFHLRSTSPCIDTGTSETGVPTTDMDGIKRMQGWGWDIGAYEYLLLVAPKIIASSIKVDGMSLGSGKYISRKPVIEADIQDAYLDLGMTSVEVQIGKYRYVVIPTVVDSINKIVHIICTPEAEIQSGGFAIYATNIYSKRAEFIRATLKIAGNLRVDGRPKNIPNPFRPRHKEGTTIVYILTDNGDIKFIIYDVTGRPVWQRYFYSGAQGGRVNENRIDWDGKTDFGEYAPNGAYIYLITHGDTILGKGQMAVMD